MIELFMVNEEKNNITTLKFNRSECEAITAAKVQDNQSIKYRLTVV